MEKGRQLLRWAGILVAFAVLAGVGSEAQGSPTPAKAPAGGRPDQITIDTLAAYGKLELPAVTFFHDRHTEALAKENKSCDACHGVENNKLSLSYKRTAATKPGELQGIYHANCIGCHMEMTAAGKKSGPPDGFCRSCHNAEPPQAGRQGAGMDKVLHYRHVASKNIAAPGKEKDNCGVCHHDYDKRTQKLISAKGKEESCRVCHLDKAKDGVRSRDMAAHEQCVGCHLNLTQKGSKDSMPLTCDGCHGAAGQALVKQKNQEMVAKLKDKEALRLKRGQPDAVLITYTAKQEGGKGTKAVVMDPVPFNHKGHEQAAESCRVCHHASMQACGSCHTLTGAKEGGYVSFEQAMHRPTSQHSCIGCHAAKQATPNCAGCHNQIEASKRPDDAACRQCHLPPGKAGGAARDFMTFTAEQKAIVAETMLKSREAKAGTYSLDSVPDKVVIKELVDKYQPVEMAHRKHVQALLKGVQGNAMADYFHREPGTLCQGCHHNSPASLNPPHCGSCHAKNFDAKEPKRPGLQAAFHGQCMTCHKDMGVKPVATACTECHQAKQQ